MKHWHKMYWRSELQSCIRFVLREGDMTLNEIRRRLGSVFGIRIAASALSQIVRITNGVYVKRKKYSIGGCKMINVYTIGVSSNGVLDIHQKIYK